MTNTFNCFVRANDRNSIRKAANNWKIELGIFFQNFGFLKICHLVLAKFAARAKPGQQAGISSWAPVAAEQWLDS